MASKISYLTWAQLYCVAPAAWAIYCAHTEAVWEGNTWAMLHCEGCGPDHSQLLALGHFPTVPPLSRVTPLAVAASISCIFLLRLAVFTAGKQHWAIASKSRVTKNICLPSGNNVAAVVCLQHNHAFRNHNRTTKRSHTGRKRETLVRRGRTP